MLEDNDLNPNLSPLAPLEQLARDWPVFRRPVRPLAVGIRAELIEAGWSEQNAGALLAGYTSTEAYHTAVAHGGARYDLRGQLRGRVSDTERAHALKALHTLKMMRSRPPMRWAQPGENSADA